MNFDKVVLVKELSEIPANASLDAEDGLVDIGLVSSVSISMNEIHPGQRHSRASR